MWVFCENTTEAVEANDADRRDPNTSKGGAVPLWGAVSDFERDRREKLTC